MKTKLNSYAQMKTNKGKKWKLQILVTFTEM